LAFPCILYFRYLTILLPAPRSVSLKLSSSWSFLRSRISRRISENPLPSPRYPISFFDQHSQQTGHLGGRSSSVFWISKSGSHQENPRHLAVIGCIWSHLRCCHPNCISVPRVPGCIIHSPVLPDFYTMGRWGDAPLGHHWHSERLEVCSSFFPSSSAHTNMSVIQVL
jgi:hypothetical protein